MCKRFSLRKATYIQTECRLILASAIITNPVTPPPQTNGDYDSDVIDVTPSPAPKHGHFPNRPRPKRTPQALKPERHVAPDTPPEDVVNPLPAATYEGISLSLPLTEIRQIHFSARAASKSETCKCTQTTRSTISRFARYDD